MPDLPSAEMRTAPPVWRVLYERVGLYLELGKARLSALVVVTAAVGYVLAGPPGLDWAALACTVVGVALAALGANALNEWWEVARDARMNRTCRRPLPLQRLKPSAALAFGCAAGLVGPGLLLNRNALAAALALLTLLIYVLAYTPLKARTPANTLVGAVVGAIPPMIGWAAATGRLETGAWILAGILFLWQIPHFLALAWIYREDYARGGFRMLPSVDPHGHLTGLMVVLYSLLLVPLTLALAAAGVTGGVYAAGAALLGTGLLGLAVVLERRRTTPAARRVFLASVIYLPLLLGLSVLDRRPTGRASDLEQTAAAAPSDASQTPPALEASALVRL